MVKGARTIAGEMGMSDRFSCRARPVPSPTAPLSPVKQGPDARATGIEKDTA